MLFKQPNGNTPYPNENTTYIDLMMKKMRKWEPLEQELKEIKEI